MKDLLKGISKAEKVEFLKKLESGKFTLVKPYKLMPKMNFTLQADGLYKCKESGKVMTKDEILALPGFKIKLEIVENRPQVTGEELAAGYCLIPFSKTEYLASLLRGEKDLTLIYDEKNQVFDCEQGQFSFSELAKFTNDNPDIVFYMNEDTKRHYIEHLENYC